ncbi:phage tail spike protein [Clostridium tertium]|uniref:phage tail spike protein n=1 Tax=Clostridium tertium TaxID=1559 RepID=UPI001AEB8E25|nr:phage tail spike protein [Clostridium tertium]MBP1869020.1 phage minor structural protein [Clostridium tertium]
MIKIFKQDETDFSHDGIEVLDDIAISSYTDWSEKNKWIIQAKFKKDFDKSETIKEGLIIQVPTEKGEQLFRILKINKKNRKYISISGHAIGYDFNDNFIQDINIVEKSGRVAIHQISNGTVYPHRYNISSNIDRVASARMIRKNGIEALIGTNKDNTFIERWGGCLVLDNFNISVNEAVGEDRGVEIAIGKNVTAYDGDIDEEAVCTGINAITYDGLTLPEGIYYSPLVNNYPHPKIREFKFDNIKYKYSENNNSEEGYETLEEVYEAIRKACNDLFNIQNIDKPTCSLRVNIAALENTDQYKGDELNERIFQGDILTANLEDYGFNVKLKMIANRYDNIRKRYIDIDLGDAKNNIFNDINKIEIVIGKVVEQLGGNSWKDILDKSMKEASELIAAGIKDSYVVARKNEILIMDSPKVESAINVIRMNKNGIAFSRSGYNGPYTLAITIDGKINASCILTGELDAALIKTGVITSYNGNVQLNIDDDYIQVSHSQYNTRTRLDAEGFYINDENGETIASLASKKSWTELKADKVFANNIENIYEGPSNLYVNHNSNNIVRDGSIEYPFTSFLELNNYLNSTPIINKDIIINVITSGVIGDRIFLEGLKGIGFISINFNKDLIVKNSGIAIEINNTSNSVRLNGNRTRYDSNDGCLFDTSVGIKIENCQRIFAGWFRCKNTEHGAKIYCSNVQLWQNDMCNANVAVEASYNSRVNCIDLCGNNNVVYRSVYGSIIHFGEANAGSWRPIGALQATSGSIFGLGNVSLTGSFHTAPPIPPTIDQYREFSYSDYGYWSDLYGNWNPNGKTVYQGNWGYGNNRGIFVFNNSDISGFLANSTVLDGSTITLQRENAGGYSQAQTIYLCGTTHTSPGGSAPPVTKSYGALGSLAWGGRGTFNLPKSFVQDLKAGTIKSAMFYTGDGSNYIKFSPVCTLRLKINK